jgi:hypothetical protein
MATFSDAQTQPETAAPTADEQSLDSSTAAAPTPQRTHDCNPEYQLFLSLFDLPATPVGPEQFARIHDDLYAELAPQTSTERTKVCILAGLYLQLVLTWQLIIALTAPPPPTELERRTIRDLKQVETDQQLWKRLIEACDSGRAFDCPAAEAERVASRLRSSLCGFLPPAELVALGLYTQEMADMDVAMAAEVAEEDAEMADSEAEAEEWKKERAEEEAERLAFCQALAPIKDVILDVKRSAKVLCGAVPVPPSQRLVWRTLLDDSFPTSDPANVKRQEEFHRRRRAHTLGLTHSVEQLEELYRIEETMERSIWRRLQAYRQGRAAPGGESRLRSAPDTAAY